MRGYDSGHAFIKRMRAPLDGIRPGRHFRYATEDLDHDPRPKAHQIKRAEMEAEGDNPWWGNAIRQLEDS